MSTLGLNTRVWVAWWPASELDKQFMERMGDPRLQYGTIKNGPIQIPLIGGDFWQVFTDNDTDSWLCESVLWPVGGEPMDISENRDVTRPVEEHSNQ